MLGIILSTTEGLLQFSLPGCLKLALFILIIYLIYFKTSTPAFIARLLPTFNISINIRTFSINNLSNDVFGTFFRTIKINTECPTGDNETKNEKKTVKPGHGVENMLDVTPHATRKPFSNKWDLGLYFPHLAQVLRSKKYEYAQVSYAVENDPEIKRAIKHATEQILREQRIQQRLDAARSDDAVHMLLTHSNNVQKNGNENKTSEVDNENFDKIFKQQENRARFLLRGMRSTLSNFLLSLTSWVLYKLFPYFISGVVTHTEQIEMLRQAEARAPGVPLIFLPLHRSHLDYIMCTFILTNNDIRSPLVAAGDNLKIPVFCSLLRGLGAFYIKRKIDPVAGKKDILYRAVLQLYLQHALRMGHNVEFFIEGGRTRTGKPCMPKGGLLSVIVNAFMDHSISDALLIPVSINYERLVDGNFVTEQKGEQKKPESFSKAISSIWKALTSKYGLMRIDFNQPYSLRELIQSYNMVGNEETKVYKPSSKILKHNQSTSSLYGTDVICEEHRNLIESISRQVVFDCSAATSVMSTNALAFLLLTKYREGTTESTLAGELDKLRLKLKGHRDLGFAGESNHIISYACDILSNKLIKRTQICPDNKKIDFWIEPVEHIDSFIELAYYCNMLAPHFALQSIMLCTFHKLLQNNIRNDEEGTVLHKKLIESTMENCGMYRYEFILHKPTQTLEQALIGTLNELTNCGYIMLKEKKNLTKSEEQSKNIAKSVAYAFDDSDAEEQQHDVLNAANEEEKYIISCDADKIEDQLAICVVVAPVCYTYLTVAQTLYMLYKNSMLESDFTKCVIKDLTSLVNKGDCPYAESISTDSVRNCIKLLEKWSVIDICNHNGMRLLSLTSLYDLSLESLKTIIQRIDACLPKLERINNNI